MLRFAKTPPKTPPPRKTKYVPLEPMKPKTQEQLAEEELAITVADGLFAMGRGGLRDSKWASPQYNKRVKTAPIKVAMSQEARDFFSKAAKAGIKIGPSPPAAIERKAEAPVVSAGVLATPPATPPPTAEISVAVIAVAPAPAAVSSELQNKIAGQQAVKAVPVAVVAPPAQQYSTSAPSQQRLQPGVTLVETQAHSVAAPVDTRPQPSQPSGYLPPHLLHLRPGFKSVQPQTQSTVPQGQTTAVVSPSDLNSLRGSVASQQVQGSAPPHSQGRKSASPSPTLQAHATGPPKGQYVPPHLRGSVPAAIPAALKLELGQGQKQTVVPPHLHRPVQLTSPTVSKLVQPQNYRVVPSQVQSTPPHLRGSVQVSPPQMAIHQTSPHLRGISSQTSQLSTTQFHNNTTPSQIVGTTMAPTCYPSRPMNDGQDDFLQWLSHKKPTQKVEVTEQVIIKSEEPLNSVRSPQALPVRSPRSSPSKESTNSNWSQEPVKNINDTDDFLSYMNKPKSKVYGVPPEASKSPNQTLPTDGWQRPKTAFDNPHWKLNDNSVANFETYIKNGASPSSVTPAAQVNSVHGTANVRAAKVQAAQVMASKVQYPHQKLTFNGAQKLGQSASQPKQIVQSGPTLSIENKNPVAQAPVKIDNVATNFNTVAPAKSSAQADIVPNKAAEWQGLPNMHAVAAMISADINNVQPQASSNTSPLTNEALVLTTGFKTVNQNNYSDDRISSTGLGKLSSDHAQDPRHTQGNDMVNQFFEWDGSRAPVPIWEDERPSFDDSFIPEYIKEWQKTLPSGQFKVDIEDDKFTSGVYPISNVSFVDPILQGPDTVPDVAENTTDQEIKRQFQTAEIEANNYSVAIEDNRKQVKRQAKASKLRHREIAAKEDEPNPFSPTIGMYMRPAEEKDATDVVAIYNWYISNSNIPEDQEPITEEDGKWIIKQAKDDNLPFLVAIKGRQPSDVDAQGRSSQKIMLPACEQVIGFCFPERFNYGFAGKVARSRATVNLQLYVHNEYTRKGVGRNLLDRLIHILNPGYAYKNATAWINPSIDKLYETEGAGLFHQLLFQIPVEHKDDPNIAWLTKFLLKFLFKEKVFREGDKEHPKRLTLVCRSTTTGRMAHFLDLAIFHYEARQEGEFDPYM
ncbi:hypothetical protein ONS96_000240 [Cadophora gregata f. sp. sojae]|nr:hypothetical protein ONS96_000240 [Cadophora gregata f. sp. sojae]